MNKFEWIKSNIVSNDVVVDIGCGDKGISQQINCKKLITVDAWEKANPDILVDLENSELPLQDNSVDVILLIDFIEHLTKERGTVLLKQLKNIVRKKILLLTPLWWSDNSENVNKKDTWYYGNTYDYHKSLWTLDDFIDWERIFDVYKHEDYFIGIWRRYYESTN